MTKQLSSLRAQIADYVTEAWGDHEDRVARVHWREQSGAKIREDMREWGLNPDNQDLATGYLLGQHWLANALGSLLDSATRHGSTVFRSHLSKVMADGYAIAEDRLRSAEQLSSLRAPGKLRVAIDLDGVVADFNRWVIDRWNADNPGADLDVSQVTGWDCWREMMGFPDGSVGLMSWLASNHPHVFRLLDTYPGALGALRQIAMDHHLVVLTARPKWAAADTLRWLGMMHIPATEVHITEDKPAVKCDVYVDDAAHNLEALVARRPESVVVRWAQPWCPPVEGAVDCQPDFSQLLDLLAMAREDA